MQRYKSFTRQFFGLWGWMTLGAVAIFLIFLTVAMVFSRSAGRLEAEGADATATVIDRRMRKSGNDSTDYLIRYSFNVGSRTVEAEQEVSLTFYRDLVAGQTVPVRYWTADPSLSEIEAGAASAASLIGWIGAALSALVALVLGRIATRRALHGHWLIRHGVRRQATITDHRVTNVRINDIQQWQAVWREPDGREGSTRMARREDLPAEGAQITLLVDPNGHHPSLWEGDLVVPADRIAGQGRAR